MSKLFGFSIESPEKKSKTIASPIPPNNQDGVDNYISSGFYGCLLYTSAAADE